MKNTRKFTRRLKICFQTPKKFFHFFSPIHREKKFEKYMKPKFVYTFYIQRKNFYFFYSHSWNCPKLFFGERNIEKKIRWIIHEIRETRLRQFFPNFNYEKNLSQFSLYIPTSPTYLSIFFFFFLLSSISLYEITRKVAIKKRRTSPPRRRQKPGIVRRVEENES